MFAALGIALIINCSGGGKDSPTAPTAPVAPVVVGSVTVGGTPAEGALLVGGSVTLTATAVSTTGSTVSGRTTTWSSSDPSVATVAAGAVVGVASGPVTISASVDGVVGRTTLSVRVPISTPPAGASTPTVAAVLSGAVTLTIPPTAVPTGTALSVAPAALPSDNRVVPATTYVFGPDGTTFSSPLTLALRYDKAAVATADQSTLWLASVDASGVATPIAGSAVDLTTGVVSAPVSHFSSYTIIKPAAPASIAVVSGDAQSATVGTAPSTAISVRVLDASSRPVPGASVRFAVASGNGTLSGTATATTNYLGVATFAGTWVLGTASGAQTLTATPTTGSATAATITATGIASTATKLVLSGTGTQVAGATQTVTVTAKDANGNTATTYTGAKSLTFSGAATAPGGQKPTAGGTAFGTATSVTFTNGVATLPLVLNKAEGAKVSISDGLVSTATADQLSVAVAPGAATQIALTTSAAGAVAGAAFATQPVVAIRDAVGNDVTTATGVVTMTVSGGAATVGTATATVVNGIATFTSVGVSSIAGTSYTLSFSSTGLAPATQTITTAVGSATQLVLTTSAAGAASGAAFTTQPVVKVQDAGGNTVVSATAAVTMTVSSGATIVGTATVAATNGVATFTNVGIMGTAGTSYTLTFATDGLTAGTQAIVPTAGAATKLVITTSAAGASSGAAFTTQPVVAVQDLSGNTVKSANTSVTMTVSAGATIVGTATVQVVNGIATFSNSGISGASGTSYTLAFAASALTSATQSIVPTAGAATRLVLTKNAGASSSGAAFTPQPVISVGDAYGNIVVSSTASVSVNVSAGATIVGTASISAINGVAAFGNIGISGVSGTSYTLTYTATGLTEVTQPITVFGVATQLVVSTTAAGAASGVAFTTQPVIVIRDASGNTVTNATNVVTMAVSTGATLVGTVTATAINGVATFVNAGISGAAGTSYTLTFSANGLTSATQAVSPFGTATKLTLTTSAAGSASGSAFSTQPQITVRDAFGSIVTSGAASQLAVTMTVTGAGSPTIVGTSTVTAVNGVAAFTNLGITGAAGSTYTLTYSANGGTITAVTQTITPVAGQAKQLAFTTNAGGAASGAPFATQPVVAVRDGYGNAVTAGAAAQLIVSIAVSSGATLVGTSSATAVNGVASFANVGVSGKSGTSYTLTVSSDSLTSATQSIVPTPGAPAKLVLTTLAAGAAAGGNNPFAVQPKVSVQDAFGNAVTTSPAVVTMVVDSGGAVRGTTTATTVAGVATFTNAGISGTGGASYTLSFNANGLAAATQPITVAGSGTKLVLTAPAAGASSGAAFTTQPQVSVLDAFNNPVMTGWIYTVTMTVTSGATVVGTATATTVNGVAKFSTVGIGGVSGTDYTLTYTCTFGTDVLTPVTQLIRPSEGVPAQLQLTTPAAGAASGVPFTTQPQITIQDAYGNTVTKSTLTVTISTRNPSCCLQGNNSATAVNGVATFVGEVLNSTAGPVNLSYNIPNLPPVYQSIVVEVGPATKLALTTPVNLDPTSGAAFTRQPEVTVQDSGNNTVISGSASQLAVTMTVNNGAAPVGNATVAAVNGVAKFTNVGISGPAGGGACCYTISFSATGVAAAVQSNLLLLPGVGTKLSLATRAQGAASGAAFVTQPQVTIQDAFGNTTGTSGVVVTMSVNGTNLVGTATATTVNGVATFTNVGIGGGPGSYTLSFTANGLATVTQSITVPGTATKLQLTVPAAGAASGAGFKTQPQVTVVDAFNSQVVGGEPYYVTMTVSSGATIVGTATAATVNGVAAFTNIGLSGPAGSSYVLTFAATGLASATESVDLAAGQATQLIVTRIPAGRVAGGTTFTTQPVVTVQDAFGNTTNMVLDGFGRPDNLPVTMSATGNVSSGVVAMGPNGPGTATANVVNGIAAFSGAGVAFSGPSSQAIFLTFSCVTPWQVVLSTRIQWVPDQNP